MNVHLRITEARSHSREQTLFTGQWSEAAACEYLLQELRLAEAVCFDHQTLELTSSDQGCVRRARFRPPVGRKGRSVHWQRAVGAYLWFKPAAGESLASDCLRLLLVPGTSAQPCWRKHASRLRRLGVFALFQAWCQEAGVTEANVVPLTLMDRVRNLFRLQAA
jgi:hypothetical protein